MADQMQAWTGNIVTLGQKAPEAGGWLAVTQGQSVVIDERDRVGKQSANTLFGSGSSMSAEHMSQQDRILTNEQLWLVYKRTPDVRAAVDAIVRRVATWNWLVEPKLAPDDPLYDQAIQEAAAARDFMVTPNTDGETWQELWTKVITDLMVFDAGVIENVYHGEVQPDGVVAETEDLAELVALRGSTVFPLVDPHGHVLGYRQNSSSVLGTFPIQEEYEGGKSTLNPSFGPEQIVYMRLFPNTSSPLGVPIIETIINEIITMIRQSEHAMLAFDADEIPPGILVLTGIAGKAAAAAKADLQKLRGKDHKVRVITNPDPKATGANWVELRHTAKDTDLVNVVDRVRRTIWRVFGVLPVEMGASEDIPRSVGQVQLEVSGSHLINPILELVEAKINARILPLVVDDPEAGKRIRFRFDRESKLSPEDQKAMAATLISLIREGVLTRNEARKIRGDQPTAGGDVMTVTTGQGTFTLESIITAAAEGPSGEADGDGEPEDDEPEDDDEPEGEEPEDEVEPEPVEAHRHPAQTRASSSLLPSSWQAAGPFAKYRTIDLPALGDEVMRYRRLVDPLYEKAQDEVVAAARSMYRPGMTEDQAAVLTQRISATMDKLEREWAIAVDTVYQRAAKTGRNAAREFTGLPVGENMEERADQYGRRAMQWLVSQGGMLHDVRSRLLVTVQALTTRAAQKAPRGTNPTMELTDAMDAIDSAFVANHHRVDNWSGRLVELSNATFVEGMLEGNSALIAGEIKPVEWWAEWVHVGDNRMCGTCTVQGSAGFRPLASLPTVPGGETDCLARCRCVLVMWMKDEVDAGTAVPLSGTLG